MRARNTRPILAVVVTAGLLVPTATVGDASPQRRDPGPHPPAPVAAPERAADSPRQGVRGIGDPYFPEDGNRGYEVGHYWLNLDFQPRSGVLSGATSIRLNPHRRLKAFRLDFLLRPSAVYVNGKPAAFRKPTRHELRVRPKFALRKGKTYRVRVAYRGRPASVRYRGERNFHRTPTGALALGQPHVAAWWFPSNDHPSDKAGFSFRLTVPRGQEAIAGGELVGRTSTRLKTTWRWRSRSEMATYLAFVAFGRYDLVRGKAAGYPFLHAFEEGMNKRARRNAEASLRATPRLTAWLSRMFGRYPYSTVGGVVPDKSLGFALETQTRPVYGRDFFDTGTDRLTVVHEMAHQWFGDRIAVRRWRNIWLNEGFATWAEWMRVEAQGGRSAQRQLMLTYEVFGSGSGFWNLPIGDPGPSHLFDSSVYTRGAMTVQALKNRIGKRDFHELARRWSHSAQTGTTTTFRKMAERISGEELSGFFRAWLTSGKPAKTKANGLQGRRG